MVAAPLPEDGFDAIVVGAGAAGLAAAAELARAGLSALVVEARDRVGGRCWTLRDPGQPVPVELGAEFIHGVPEATYALLRQAGMTTVDGSRVQRYPKSGRLVPVDAFAEAAKAMRRAPRKDLSFEKFLSARRGLSSKTRTFATLMVEGFDAADPARVSARSIAEEWAGAEGFGRVQPRPLGGYGPLLAWRAGALDPQRVRLQLATPVRAIRWRRGAVSVEASFLGKPFHASARAAIVTLPVGVLQAGTVLFSPALAAKREALRAIASGPVVKAALRFREPFWEKAHRTVAFFHAPGRPFPTFWNQLPLRATHLIAWAGGPKAAALAGLHEGEIVERALASLRTVLGRVPTPLSARAHAWAEDPWARGAYSYLLAGGQGARERLAAPLGRTLFFAGEATDAEQSGTVGGALQSGIRAARELVRARHAGIRR